MQFFLNTTLENQVCRPKSGINLYPGGMIMTGRSFNSDKYRYGAGNGQEKTDEISGTGNHYTAEFWEYDPRLIRRWNLDPVRKPWQSDYSCYSNSPIWKVDPNGDDDFFNSLGQYQYSDNKKSRTINIITIVNGKEVSTQLKDYAFSKDNAKTLTNIGAYYAKSTGLDVSNLKGGSLSVANRKWESNVPIEESFYNKGGVADWSDIMNSNENTKTISFSLDNGKISPLLNDGNNMITNIEHESDHLKISGDDGFEHLKVYFNQLTDKKYNSATEEYKNAAIGNIQEIVKGAMSYSDKTLSKETIGVIRKEGAKWKAKFEKIGVNFDSSKK